MHVETAKFFYMPELQCPIAGDANRHSVDLTLTHCGTRGLGSDCSLNCVRTAFRRSPGTDRSSTYSVSNGSVVAAAAAAVAGGGLQ